MDKEIYISLITNKLSGGLSKEEQAQLTNWLKGSPENQAIYDQVEADWALSANAKKTIEVDVDEDFLKLKNRIQEAKSSDAKKAESAKVIQLRRSNSRWLYIAASLVLLATAWFVFSPDEQAIQLVVSTTLGETRTIELADGTKVWLNENSKLTYPESFEEDAREVVLQGEGYFEVTKNTEAPFKVNLNTTTIEVLGTQFNISESKNRAEVVVHVDEGKVRFSEKTGSEKLDLVDNQAAKYAPGDKNISRLTTYNKNKFSWKSNALVFKALKLSDVLKDIKAHFGKTAVLELESMKDCIFNGYYPKPDANKVLSDIAASYDMTLTQDRNGNYLLNGGECKTQD